jgi:hypothetical protein
MILATRVKCRPVSSAISRVQARLLSYFARRQANRLGLLKALAALLANLFVPLLGALEIGLRFANRLRALA